MIIFSLAAISPLLFGKKSKLRTFWLGRVSFSPPLYIRPLCRLKGGKILGIFFPSYPYLPFSTFYGMRRIIRCFMPRSFSWSPYTRSYHSIKLCGTYLVSYFCSSIFALAILFDFMYISFLGANVLFVLCLRLL